MATEELVQNGRTILYYAENESEIIGYCDIATGTIFNAASHKIGEFVLASGLVVRSNDMEEMFVIDGTPDWLAKVVPSTHTIADTHDHIYTVRDERVVFDAAREAVATFFNFNLKQSASADDGSEYRNGAKRALAIAFAFKL